MNDLLFRYLDFSSWCLPAKYTEFTRMYKVLNNDLLKNFLTFRNFVMASYMFRTGLEIIKSYEREKQFFVCICFWNFSYNVLFVSDSCDYSIPRSSNTFDTSYRFSCSSLQETAVGFPIHCYRTGMRRIKTNTNIHLIFKIFWNFKISLKLLLWNFVVYYILDVVCSMWMKKSLNIIAFRRHDLM